MSETIHKKGAHVALDVPTQSGYIGEVAGGAVTPPAALTLFGM
jgi:hypothetical protein